MTTPFLRRLASLWDDQWFFRLNLVAAIVGIVHELVSK